MHKKIDSYLRKGQIVKDETVVSLTGKYLDKARTNLITMNVLSDLNNQKTKDFLGLQKDYDANEWVVVAGYYAMYTAALALLAKISFRSKSHAATLVILDNYYVRKNVLDKKDLELMKDAHFRKEEIEQLSDAKRRREIAQYNVTKETTKVIAEEIKKNAYEFVNKVELILAKD